MFQLLSTVLMYNTDIRHITLNTIRLVRARLRHVRLLTEDFGIFLGSRVG